MRDLLANLFARLRATTRQERLYVAAGAVAVVVLLRFGVGWLVDYRQSVKDDIQLHALNDDEYYLGIFLVGAYQEILGDLHNLFGDTHTVQVSLAPGGGYLIDRVVEGDTVTEVLNYVAYNKDDLIARIRGFAEKALREGRITLDESRQILRVYEAGLAGYTYLEREVDAKSFTATQLKLVPTSDVAGKTGT